MRVVSNLIANQISLQILRTNCLLQVSPSVLEIFFQISSSKRVLKHTGMYLHIIFRVCRYSVVTACVSKGQENWPGMDYRSVGKGRLERPVWEGASPGVKIGFLASPASSSFLGEI